MALTVGDCQLPRIVTFRQRSLKADWSEVSISVIPTNRPRTSSMSTLGSHSSFPAQSAQYTLTVVVMPATSQWTSYSGVTVNAKSRPSLL